MCCVLCVHVVCVGYKEVLCAKHAIQKHSKRGCGMCVHSKRGCGMYADYLICPFPYKDITRVSSDSGQETVNKRRLKVEWGGARGGAPQ